MLDPARSVIVVGAPHSGTSFCAHALRVAGWRFPDQGDYLYHCEPEGLIEPNGAITRILRGHPGSIADEIQRIKAWLETAPRPGVWKDPRFCVTLEFMTDLFADCQMLFVSRHPTLIRHSFVTRKQYTDQQVRGRRQPGVYGLTTEQLTERAEKRWEAWKGDKHRVAHHELLQSPQLAASLLGIDANNWLQKKIAAMTTLEKRELQFVQ